MRALTGEVMGVGLTVVFKTAEDLEADIVSLIDEAIAQLEVSIRETDAHETQSERLAKI